MPPALRRRIRPSTARTADRRHALDRVSACDFALCRPEPNRRRRAWARTFSPIEGMGIARVLQFGSRDALARLGWQRTARRFWLQSEVDRSRENLGQSAIFR